MSLISAQNYTYRVFGLTLGSEIAFPELFLSAGSGSIPDVTVHMGKAPPKESVTGTQKPYSAYNGTEFWHKMPGVAIYYVKDGKEIIIEPIGENVDEIRLFFLSNALGAMLYQRDHIPLHASGITDKSGGVYLFTAPSRTGKSTLLYMLSQMGYRPFTDDVCILEPAADPAGGLIAYAGYPMMKLWSETIEKLNADPEASLKRLRPEIEKFGLDFSDTFSDQPARVKGIIVLDRTGSNEEIAISRLTQMEAFRALEKNVYRRPWVEGMGKTITHFRQTGQWSNALPVYLAKRPATENTIGEFAEAIHRQILSR